MTLVRRRVPTLVSVVIPVRGNGQFLREALASVCLQPIPNMEIICVNDGMTPSAVGIVGELQKDALDVRVIPNEGAGIVAALNTGVREAAGEYIARMDADDVSLPHRFPVQLDYLRNNPEIAVLGSQATLIDGFGKTLRRLRVAVGTDRLHRALDSSCAIIHPTVMMRSEAVRNVGGYRPGFDGAEDFDLWLRLRRANKLDNLPDSLLLYRRHQDQVTSRHQLRQARRAAAAMVGDRLLRTSNIDYLERLRLGADIRSALALAGPGAVEEMRGLTACLLADNGGSLHRLGARYLAGACARVGTHTPPELSNRLALASVRHQLNLMRRGRHVGAISAAASDLGRWRGRLLSAYVRQIRSFWGPGRTPWSVLQPTKKGT